MKGKYAGRQCLVCPSTIKSDSRTVQGCSFMCNHIIAKYGVYEDGKFKVSRSGADIAMKYGLFLVCEIEGMDYGHRNTNTK